MSLVVCTIEHAGTKELLRDLGWLDDGTGRSVCPLEEEKDRPNSDIFFCHLYPENLPLIQEAAKRMKVYTTERAPLLIRQTWINNGRESEAEFLEAQFATYDEVLKLDPFIVKLGARPEPK